MMFRESHHTQLARGVVRSLRDCRLLPTASFVFIDKEGDSIMCEGLLGSGNNLQLHLPLTTIFSSLQQVALPPTCISSSSDLEESG